MMSGIPVSAFRLLVLAALLGLCSCGTQRKTTATAGKQPDVGRKELRKVLRTAEKQLGVPYRWGGKTPAGFDCSGFTGYCFASVHVKLPATAAAQSETGRKVRERHIRKGDLLFFTGPDERRRTPGHVGIVFSVKNGDVRFIHAATNGVMISSLNETYYRKRLLKIKRVG